MVRYKQQKPALVFLTENSVYLLLQSMIKVFSFLKVKFQFSKDEVREVSVKYNIFNKAVTCKFSENVTIDILPIFIKAAVFYHVDLSWRIKTKEKYTYVVEDSFIEWFTVVSRFNGIFCWDLHGPIFEGFFFTDCQYRYDEKFVLHA